MASVSIALDFSSATHDTVTVFYSITNISAPQKDSYSGSWEDAGYTTDTEYQRRESWTKTWGSPNYRWTIDGGSASGASGTYDSGSKTSGTKVTIQASLTVTWTATITTTIQTRSRTKDAEGNWGMWQPNTPTITTTTDTDSAIASTTLDAWTKAEEFSWSINVSPDQLIELTAADWNKLIETVQKNVNWQKQQDANPSIATVNSNDWITAKAYNDIASLAGMAQVKADDIITAELINALSNGVNGMKRG